MMAKFEMKDLGLMSYFLGLEMHLMKDDIFCVLNKIYKRHVEEIQNG